MNKSEIERLSQVRQMVRNGEARRLREGADISRAELAAFAQVSMTTIWRWEQGDRRPHGEAALRYLNALELIARSTPQASHTTEAH